jgi:S1-C subfamily serine protease
MIQISGQQGVPVITVDGQVVIGFNQPRLMQLLSQTKPRLGASIADAASQAQKHPGIPSSGAYVGRVRPGSAAEQAGLRPGDVITFLSGQPVRSAEDVHQLVARLPKGGDVPLAYVRDGQERRAFVRL